MGILLAMRGGYSKIVCCHRSSAVAAVILVFIIYGGIARSVAAAPAERILQLTPDIEHYYLGNYLSYLEDPLKNLTIDDVSSPQMSLRFVGNTDRIVNLGLNSSAYWIRFTVDAFKDQTSQKKWLLFLDWPNRIDYATLYIPKFPDGGWYAKEVGHILPTGPDPQPSTPSAFLPTESFIQPVTFYLRVESSEAKIIPLQILTDEAYREVSRARSLWFGVYYDFIASDSDDKGQLTIAIGDVSGHGISSALLMATVRSALRQRLSQPGNSGGIISDVNRQLVQDVEDTGQFMTLSERGHVW
jgi:hypothetical protein